MEFGPENLAPETPLYRIGGAGIDNLRLKPREEQLAPPGISVFLGETADEAAWQVRNAFPRATRLIAAARTVAATMVGAVREKGFDVIHAPTRHFPNHGRLIHPDDVEGFSDENLRELSKVFHDVTGVDNASQS